MSKQILAVVLMTLAMSSSVAMAQEENLFCGILVGNTQEQFLESTVNGIITKDLLNGKYKVMVFLSEDRSHIANIQVKEVKSGVILRSSGSSVSFIDSAKNKDISAACEIRNN